MISIGISFKTVSDWIGAVVPRSVRFHDNKHIDAAVVICLMSCNGSEDDDHLWR